MAKKAKKTKSDEIAAPVFFLVTKNSVPVGLFEFFDDAENQGVSVYTSKTDVVYIDALYFGITDADKVIMNTWVLMGKKFKLC